MKLAPDLDQSTGADIGPSVAVFGPICVFGMRATELGPILINAGPESADLGRLPSRAWQARLFCVCLGVGKP